MKISVALCTYNGEKYIQKQLDSILAQTIRVNEIIICDDNSTDDTISVIEQYINTFSDIIKLHKNPQNIGVIKNFEKAISLTTGDIVFLSDQDDLWVPQKVEITVGYFQSHPSIFVTFSNGRIINHDGQLENYTIFDCVGLNEDILKLWKKFSLEILSWRNRVTGATIAFKKKYYDQLAITFIDGHSNFLHDYQLAIKAADQDCIGFINQQLIEYRLHQDQCLGLSLNFADSFGNFNLFKPILTSDLFQSLINNKLKVFLFANRRIGWVENTLFVRIRVVLWHMIEYIKIYKSDAIKYIANDIVTPS